MNKSIPWLLVVFCFLAFSVAAIAQMSCSSNADCDDSNPQTYDYCHRPSEQNSGCSNLSCTPACQSDGDCDDGDDSTLDVCAGIGRCTASCSHLTLCGNGETDPGETSCNCPQDIGECGGDAGGVCREFSCVGEVCQETLALGCCNNNICELGENFSTCQTDCKVKNLQIEIQKISEDDYYIRGEEITVRAVLTADTVKVTDAQVEMEGFFGKLALVNDGRHNDDAPFDNVYANTLIIPGNIEADTYPITVNTVFENNRGIKTFDLIVEPKLEIRLNLAEEEIFLGDEIKVNGIVSKKTKGIKSGVLLTVYSNNIPVAKETVQTNDLGEFSFSYRTSFLDSAGEWKVEAFTKDELENTGFEEKTITVSLSDVTAFLNVSLAKEIKETYVRGEEIPVSISLTDKDQKPVSGAQVSALIPGTAPLMLDETNGLYEGKILVGHDFPLGEHEIKINALKSDQNSFFAGSTTIKFSVEATQIKIEITAPTAKSFQIGEEIEFKVNVNYPDNKPVILSQIDSNVNKKTIVLNAVDQGVYSGKYVVTEADQPRIFFEVLIDDSYGNTAYDELELEVSGTSVFHYLRVFGIQIIAGLIVLLLIAGALFFVLSKQNRLSNLKKQEKRTLEELKKIQAEYFKEGTLDRKNYERLLEKYENILADTRKSIQQLNEKK